MDFRLRIITICLILLNSVIPVHAEDVSSGLTDQAAKEHLRLLCTRCHNGKTSKAEVRLDLPVHQIGEQDWQKIVQVLHHFDMPPKGARQPDRTLRSQLESWAQRHLDRHVLKRAGDPGNVSWRRLTRMELDNVIRDLTGQPIQASRHFPTENFGGEGFSNVGKVQNALSGPVLEKYLAMAGEVARHARFDQSGRLTFDPPGAIRSPEVRRDEVLYDIKPMARKACGELYLGPGKLIGGEKDERSLDSAIWEAASKWEGPGRYLECLWLVRASENPEAALPGVAAAQRLNLPYLQYLWHLWKTCPPDSLEEALWVKPLKRLPAPASINQPIPQQVQQVCGEAAGSVWSCIRRGVSQGKHNPRAVPAEPSVLRSGRLHVRLTSTRTELRGKKKIKVNVPAQRLVLVISHVVPEPEGTVVSCGLPTITLREPDRIVMMKKNGSSGGSVFGPKKSAPNERS